MLIPRFLVSESRKPWNKTKALTVHLEWHPPKNNNVVNNSDKQLYGTYVHA